MSAPTPPTLPTIITPVAAAADLAARLIDLASGNTDAARAAAAARERAKERMAEAHSEALKAQERQFAGFMAQQRAADEASRSREQDIQKDARDREEKYARQIADTQRAQMESITSMTAAHNEAMIAAQNKTAAEREQLRREQYAQIDALKTEQREAIQQLSEEKKAANKQMHEEIEKNRKERAQMEEDRRQEERKLAQKKEQMLREHHKEMMELQQSHTDALIGKEKEIRIIEEKLANDKTGYVTQLSQILTANATQHQQQLIATVINNMHNTRQSVLNMYHALDMQLSQYEERLKAFPDPSDVNFHATGLAVRSLMGSLATGLQIWNYSADSLRTYSSSSVYLVDDFREQLNDSKKATLGALGDFRSAHDQWVVANETIPRLMLQDTVTPTVGGFLARAQHGSSADAPSAIANKQTQDNAVKNNQA